METKASGIEDRTTDAIPGAGLSLLAAAREVPNQEAWVLGGKVWTFDDLAPRVASAAQVLFERTRGVLVQPVGLVGASDQDTLIWLYGAIEAQVPVALAHPRATQAEADGFFADCGVSHTLREPPPPSFVDPSVLFSVPGSAESTLAIVQTSGSAGRPKGVALSRRAFAAAAAASTNNLGWEDSDRWLLSLPVAHIGGLSILTRCLQARRAMVIEPQLRFDAKEVAATILSDRVTLLSLVPTTLGRLLDLEDWRPPDFLRAVLVGGAACPAALLGRAAECRLPVLATYGLSEACSQAATQRLGAIGGTAPGCGRPLPGTEIRICHGRIEVRGASLFNGYIRAGKIEPLGPGEWFPTGDRGELDVAGRLRVLGRADRVIISGGENVQPEEVETTLRSFPGITEVCVFGSEDPVWGQVVSALVTAVEPLSLSALADFLETRLARFKIPRRLLRVSALPRLPSGKVDLKKVSQTPVEHLQALKPSRKS